jgi:enoyl reductase-like protein
VRNRSGIDELTRAVDLLVRQVGHWTAPRWRGRADGVHALVQRIADLTADAEGEPRRVVPRLENDLALADQLRVVAADLVAARPPAEVLAVAAADVRDVRASLS